METARHIVTLIRPSQWIKNALLFFPAFFAGTLFEGTALLKLSAGFVGFSLVSSAVYILNDFFDAALDKHHPEKARRPLARGALSIHTAFLLLIVLLFSGLIIGTLVLNTFALLLIIYFLINIFYSSFLKSLPIIDLVTIAAGFIIRVLSGGIIAQVIVSHWLLLMTFLLALFLGLAKRKDDVDYFIENGVALRTSVHGYTIDFIRTAMTMMAAVLIVTYILYTMSEDLTNIPRRDYLFFTTFFVIVGILRYLQITFVEHKSGSPIDILWHDRFIQAITLGWLTLFFFALYA